MDHLPGAYPARVSNSSRDLGNYEMINSANLMEFHFDESIVLANLIQCEIRPSDQILQMIMTAFILRFHPKANTSSQTTHERVGLHAFREQFT